LVTLCIFRLVSILPSSVSAVMVPEGAFFSSNIRKA